MAVGIGDTHVKDGDIELHHLVLMQKRLQGSLFGQSHPTSDIPAQLAMYQRGQLNLDDLITTRHRLQDINQGFADLKAGKNMRGVVIFD